MAELTLIRKAAHNPEVLGDHHLVLLRVARATLAKRRWRGIADDGREFGFDLDEPLSHGVLFFSEGAARYVTEQLPEELLEIPIATLEQASRLAWSLGNLHFAVQVLPYSLRVTDDPAVLKFLSRGIAFHRVSHVFLPFSTGLHHYHD